MWRDWVDHLWQDHLRVNPRAGVIRDLLRSRGEVIHNDHLALRTFSHPDFCIQRITPALLQLGYRACATYDFELKKLSSQHFEHPDPQAPKVFVSELLLDRLSAKAQGLIHALLAQCDPGLALSPGFWWRGCDWLPVSMAQYRELNDETEVGAWLATVGFRANHFTVDVKALATFRGLADLNTFLKAEGYPLNLSGGEIKGSPQQGLEQSSTLANRMMIKLADGEMALPTCYDEFALRHQSHDGILFEGFLTESADKIFESTNRTPPPSHRIR
jgi:hypothetical protein